MERFLLSLQERSVCREQKDKVIWTGSKNGKFSIKALYSTFCNGEEDGQRTPHALGKNDIYLLKPSPSFEFDPMLELFPMKLPKQRSLLLAAHKSSKLSSLEKKNQ